MTQTLNIFHYDDYRLLVRDFTAMKQQALGRRFSYRAFGKQAGFAASNYIQLIIAGKKSLAPTGIRGLARALSLSEREHSFFESLVHFNQVESITEKDFYLKRMMSFREFTQGHELAIEYRAYFSKWYYIAIRELITLPTFKEQSDWIAQQFKNRITAKEAREALDLLHRLKMIKRDSNGRWRLHTPHVLAQTSIYKSLIKTYHQEVIEQGKIALLDPSDSREFHAITMAIGETQFNVIKEKTLAFTEDIRRYLAQSTATPPDRVCELNLQFFHLTTSTKPKRRIKPATRPL